MILVCEPALRALATLSFGQFDQKKEDDIGL